MIPARKSRWFTRWFAGHARTRIERTFGRVLVAGLDELRAALAEGPVVVVANHTSWWDPLVALWLTHHVVESDAFAMMDAANLRRLPFFGKVGAFGVDLDDPADGARAIRHAARLLDRPGRLVWIYPQGAERSPFGRLELRPGAALVGRVARRARVVPIGVRYVFARTERPDLWISIGASSPTERDSARGIELQKTAIEAALARIDRALEAEQLDGFVTLAESRPGVLARAAERLLAWAVRFF